MGRLVELCKCDCPAGRDCFIAIQLAREIELIYQRLSEIEKTLQKNAKVAEIARQLIESILDVSGDEYAE